MAPFTIHGGLSIQAIPLPEWKDGAGGGDRLPCGTGACGACHVRTRDKAKLFCVDGPAFALDELRWEGEHELAGAR